MKIPFTFLLASLCVSATASPPNDPRIVATLRKFRGGGGVGGAGNGGGRLALGISRRVNARIFQLADPSSEGRRVDYRIAVGSYDFCWDDRPAGRCETIQRFYPVESAFLVDRDGWLEATPESQSILIDSMAREFIASTAQK